MADVYEQLDKHTKRVSACALLNANGDNVGRIVTIYPRGGAGRLYAYVQAWGDTASRGSASGYGYDKQAAAIGAAIKGLPMRADRCDPKTQATLEALKSAGATSCDSGFNTFRRALESAGLTVINVI